MWREGQELLPHRWGKGATSGFFAPSHLNKDSLCSEKESEHLFSSPEGICPGQGRGTWRWRTDENWEQKCPMASCSFLGDYQVKNLLWLLDTHPTLSPHLGLLCHSAGCHPKSSPSHPRAL